MTARGPVALALARWQRCGGGRASEAMPPKMAGPRDPEYRNVALGERQAAIAARRQMDRETHTLVLELTADGIPKQQFNWWADLRRGRMRFYGGLLRAIDRAVEKGIPKERMLMIPEWIRAYIEDVYADAEARHTA